MATPQWIPAMLRQRGVPFELLHHREAFTSSEVAAAEHVSGHRLVKVVVVMADGRPVELVLPATRRVVLERVREALGAREVRLASEDEMRACFPGSAAGAVPPLGPYQNVPVLMDCAMEVQGDIVMQAGTHEDAVKLRYEDWFRIVEPEVVAFSEP